MILDLPNIGPVQFRDDLTEEQLSAQLNQLAGALGFEIPKGELTTGEMAKRAFTRGAKRLGSTFGDVIPAMGAKALGFDEYAQKQMGEAAETEKEIAKYYAPQYESTANVKGLGDVPGFALETVIEQIPNIVTSIIPGVGVGAIAARTGLTAVGKTLALDGIKKGLTGEALTQFVAENLAQTQAKRMAFGQGAGAYLGSYAQNAPEIFQNVYQATGQMDVPASLIFGAGSAALDSILPARLASKLTGPAKIGIVENLLAKSGMEPSLLRSITAEMLKGVSTEGLTEGAQEAIGIAAEKFVAGHPQIFESADWNRIMESSIRGAIAGSAFGGAGGVGARVQEKRQEFAQEQQRQAEEKRQELARTVEQAGLTIDEYNALQKQGVLPGMEMGMYTQLLTPKAKEEAVKELKGKQLSLFDEQGVPTKVAEASKTKGDKAEAIRIRQLEKREAAALKATQEKLKKFFGAKQGELDLQEAPPAGGIAVEGQPDLFGTAQVSEPTVVKKPGKLTPQEVGTRIDDSVLGSLGIGSTALIRKNKLLEGKDISNPADAAEVRRILEAYADRKNLSTSIREKVEQYLSRPEFQAQEVLSEPAISEPTRPVGGELQPSVPSVEQQPAAEPAAAGITEPDTTGLGVAGPAAKPAVGREEAVSSALGDYFDTKTALNARYDELQATYEELDAKYWDLQYKPEQAEERDRVKAERDAVANEQDAILEQLQNLKFPSKEDTNRSLGRKEQADVAKAEAAIEPAIEEKIKFIEQSDNNVLSMMEKQLPKGADTTGLEDTDAFRLFRVVPLIQEYNALKQVIAKSGEAKQRAKNEQELAVLRNAIENSSPQGAQLLDVLDQATAREIEKFIDAANREARNAFTPEIQRRAAAIDPAEVARLEKEAAAEAKLDALTNEVAEKFNIITGKKFFLPTYVGKDLDATGKEFVENNDLSGLISHLASTTTNADVKQILNKIKGLNLKTKIEVGTPTGPLASIAPEGIPQSLWDLHQKMRDAENVARSWNYGSAKRNLTMASRRLMDAAIKEYGSWEAAQPVLISMNEESSRREDTLEGPKKSGSYDPATDTIVLDPKLGLNEHTAIHELVHAAISHVLRNPNHPLTKEITKLYEATYNQLGSSYGALDVQEFAAELVGNPEFQATLKAIKAPRSGNMFQRMMQAVAEFFGFRRAYDKGMKLVSDIVDISAGVEPTLGNKMYHGMGTAVNQAFEAVGDIGRNMPQLTTRAAENVRNTFSNIQESGLLKAGMGLLRLDNLNTIYGKELPSIQSLIDALEQRNGRQEQDIARINEQYKRFSKAVQADPKAAERMNNMAVDARLAQVDPLDPNFKTTPQNVAAYNKLRREFLSLPADLQTTYREIRQSYTDAIDKYEELLLSAASPSLQKKLKAEFEARKRLVAYVPFLRRGDYWIEYADPDTGERTVQAFESDRERDAFIAKDLPQGTQVRKYKNLQDIRFIPSNVPPTTFIGRVIRELQAEGASQEMLNSVYQSYLALMPAESISKRFMKSDDVLGMERDIVRGFGDTMIKWARKLADSEFAPKIDQAINAIQGEARANGNTDVIAAAENITSQSEFFHNPTYGKVVSGATAFSYFEYIAGNISSALINLTSLPMFSWPVLGAKFGFDKASSAMLAAGKVVTNGMEKNPRYKELYKMLKDHGQLEHTMAREVLEARRMTTGDYLGIKARILDALSYPFSATERYNRGVTAVAAYDLARGAGMSEQAAMRYALNTVKDINTSGMAVTAPKYMQHPIGRVFFTFKSFAWNSAFIVARSFHQAFKSESPEIRRIARRQLIGMYGMAGAFAGVKGLPFFGLAETIAQMINALFGDDDEPYNFDEDMREFFGELLYKGPTNFFTNLEIANRTGVAQDLVFRDDPRSIAEHGYVLSAMRNAFGPAGSYAVNAENAIKMMGEGHTERAIEALVPSWMRNGMKGMRYMSEGALTLKGDPVEEDIGAYNSLMQIIGFSPASLSSTYEKTSAAKGYEKAVGDRKQKLLNRYDMARHAGDMDLLADTQEDINNFNAKHPNNRISSTTLLKSKKAREAAEKNTINGVTFNKKMKGEIQEKFFSDED